MTRASLFLLCALCNKYDHFMCSTQKRSEPGDSRLYLESHPCYDFSKDPCLKSLNVLRYLESGRLTMIQNISKQLSHAMETLANPKIRSCRASYVDADWRDTCDCAMLGGIHRAPFGKTWYSSGAEDWEKRVTLIVRQLVAKVGGIRTAAIGGSRVRKKQNGAHKNCNPWTQFEPADILKDHSISTICSLDQAHFNGQRAKSGVGNPYWIVL
ncbi:hypothetical protein VTI74DRAFT_6529 [Chaetomium olivicolor]